MALEGIIFDGDGTLYDSMSILYDSFAELVEGLGYTYTLDAVYYDNHKHFWTSGMDSVAKYYSLDVDRDEYLRTGYKITRRNYLERAQLFPGIVELIRNLHAAGLPMLVASGMKSGIVSDVLEKYDIRKYFIDVLSCEDFGYGKRKPFVYEGALKRLELPASSVINFEDEPFALATAKTLGIHTVGVYHAHDGFDREEVAASSDILVEDYRELRLENLYKLCG